MSEQMMSARRGGKNLRAVEWFNKHVAVGTPVLYWPGDRRARGRESVTRSQAWLLGGHTPVVLVEGYAGGIALSHVAGYEPTTPPPAPTEDVGGAGVEAEGVVGRG